MLEKIVKRREEKAGNREKEKTIRMALSSHIERERQSVSHSAVFTVPSCTRILHLFIPLKLVGIQFVLPIVHYK